MFFFPFVTIATQIQPSSSKAIVMETSLNMIGLESTSTNLIGLQQTTTVDLIGLETTSIDLIGLETTLIDLIGLQTTSIDLIGQLTPIVLISSSPSIASSKSTKHFHLNISSSTFIKNVTTKDGYITMTTTGASSSDILVYSLVSSLTLLGVVFGALMWRLKR